MLQFLLCFIMLWKNFEFFSPSLSKRSLYFFLHRVSSWWSLFSIWISRSFSRWFISSDPPSLMMACWTCMILLSKVLLSSKILPETYLFRFLRISFRFLRRTWRRCIKGLGLGSMSFHHLSILLLKSLCCNRNGSIQKGFDML